MNKRYSLLSALILFFSIHYLSFAETTPEQQPAPSAQQTELAIALAEAKKTSQMGPIAATLSDQAIFNLPKGYVFIPAKEAGGILKAMGNHVGTELQGLVFSEESDNWFAVIQFEKAGYIKDDDAKNWNTDDLLTSIKDSTETTNEERKARGIPEMAIIGWVEKPRYDPANRRLVWSISTKNKDAHDNEAQGVNYNTYALGREGFLSLNLVTSLSEVETKKTIAQTLLSALDFNSGKRYADFDSSTDKVAAYGLAALVAGVAAKKLGLLAVIGIFLVKFAKIIVFGVIALFGGLFMKFKRKKNEPTTDSNKT